MEYSLGILKPDAMQRDLTEIILSMVRAVGLEIVVVKTFMMTKENVEIIYENCRNDHYFESHSQFMQSGPVTAFLVKGEGAIAKLNELVGFTEPSMAKSGTIRSMGEDICRNLIHSSHGISDVIREAKVVFSEQELREVGLLKVGLNKN